MIRKWKFIERKYLFDHPRMKIVEDVVELPDGKQAKYLREEPATSHSVAILAINVDGQVLLQQEYSYPPDKVLYQLPGGAAKSGEDIIETANRELSEESGYISRECKVIGSFYLNNRRSDRKQYVVLCKDLEKQKLQEDDEEFIESEWMSLDDIKSLVRDGKIENAGLLAALSLLELTD
ncbi:NUDIX hydrolase [Candidatus Saccharibacteria bacterium]|nr:NUDIX hydrolase [Candidatus Saccharibacteria bacterium]